MLQVKCFLFATGEISLFATGDMNFAVNYIGHYVIPGNWIDGPQSVTCIGKRKRDVEDIGLLATCDSNNVLEITIDMASHYFTGIEQVYLHHSMGKFGKQHFDDSFLIFPENSL